jgi:hypothetical protein
MSNWISVKDRLPTVHDLYLVTDGCFQSIAGFNPIRGWQILENNAIRAEWITHWMPLPEPPQP